MMIFTERLYSILNANIKVSNMVFRQWHWILPSTKTKGLWMTYEYHSYLTRTLRPSTMYMPGVRPRVELPLRNKRPVRS